MEAPQQELEQLTLREIALGKSGLFGADRSIDVSFVRCAILGLFY